MRTDLIDAQQVTEMQDLSDGDDPFFFRDQITLLQERLPTLLADIRDTWQKNDRLGLERACHALAGTAAIVGASLLARRCRELEVAVETNQPFPPEETLADLTVLSDESLKALTATCADFYKASTDH